MDLLRTQSLTGQAALGGTAPTRESDATKGPYMEDRGSKRMTYDHHTSKWALLSFYCYSLEEARAGIWGVDL